MMSKDLIVPAGELIEVIFDNLVIKNQSLLKDIPILGTVVSGFGVYSVFKAKGFEKKFTRS